MPEPMDPSENVPLPGPPKPMPPTPPVTTPTADRPRPTAEGQVGTPGEPAGPPGGEAGAPAPETRDIVVDAALRDLAAVDGADLDATLAAGESVHGTLTARLSDLGT